MNAADYRRRFAGRNKFKAQRTELDGHSFDSKVEAARYAHLKLLPEVEWIDVHPVLTLPAGIRFTADFAVWTADDVRVEDTKGPRPKSDFWRLKALFDSSHPLAPLGVVRRVRGEWIEITSKGEWK